MTGEQDHLELDGAAVLDAVRDFIARFVAFPSQAALISVTLWVAMTHMATRVHSAPRLALLSPEPGSGKSRVLEVLALLVAKAMFVFGASAAAIFRSLAAEPRTLLFDEVDAVFTKRSKDSDANEDLRALLNVGYRRGATIPRCVGPKHEIQNFDVYAPAALAGLGELPDTIMTRSHIVRMRKRLPSEKVEPFRSRLNEPQAAPIASDLAAWAAIVADEVGMAWPELPEGVVDRPAEIWEPLIAIADAAGGHWPQSARDACVEMLKVAAERDVSLGVRLLVDLRTVFGETTAMTTTDVINGLVALEEAPWGDLYGKTIQPRTLARMLRPYGVTSTKVKVGGRSLQGYRREDLWDAWERYAPLPPSPAQAEPAEPVAVKAISAHGQRNSGVPHAGSTSSHAPEPSELASLNRVPQVPERESDQNLESAAPTGLIPEVPQVPDLRGAERETAPQLTGRARLVALDLTDLDPATAHELALANLQTLAAERVKVPAAWSEAASTEPHAIAVATTLALEDLTSAGKLTASVSAYSQAAGAALEVPA
ncbi:MAG TPA: DUF3631 domain-containing protein [Trueperaceae bacterium]